MPSERLDREPLSRILQAYRPGLRLVRARRLTGGIDASVHVLNVEGPDGARSRVVLRRYPAGKAWAPPERAAREFRTLQLVRKAGVPSQEPLFLDTEGRFFDAPAMLLSYLPGRSILRPHDVKTWTEDLARAMHDIHAVTPARFDMRWLRPFGPEEVAEMAHGFRDAVQTMHSTAGLAALDALDARRDHIEWLEPCLVHEDFWAGNTVWFRGRLTGIIDWSEARLGDRRLDPAQCRVDALLAAGVGVSDAVLNAYQRLAPRLLPDTWYFDLLMGVRALVSLKYWIRGYHEAGMTDMTLESGREALEAFLRRALAEANSNSP